MAARCNIGPHGILKRLLQAYGHTVALIALAILFVGFEVGEAFRPLVFVPASLAALGYLQAWTKT